MLVLASFLASVYFLDLAAGGVEYKQSSHTKGAIISRRLGLGFCALGVLFALGESI